MRKFPILLIFYNPFSPSFYFYNFFYVKGWISKIIKFKIHKWIFFNFKLKFWIKQPIVKLHLPCKSEKFSKTFNFFLDNFLRCDYISQRSYFNFIRFYNLSFFFFNYFNNLHKLYLFTTFYSFNFNAVYNIHNIYNKYELFVNSTSHPHYLVSLNNKFL